MKKVLILAVAFAAPVAADTTGWREETEMAGMQYVGRVPKDGTGLYVQGWRNDGGTYVSDDLHALANYSQEHRLAISTERFRFREPDGVAAWTITKFMSFPSPRASVGISMECGIGPDFESKRVPTEIVAAVVDWNKVPEETPHQGGIIAAAKVDLTTGSIEPIETADVYCAQMLGD